MYCVLNRDTKRPCCKSFAEERLGHRTCWPRMARYPIRSALIPGTPSSWSLDHAPVDSLAAVSAQRSCTWGLRVLGDETQRAATKGVFAEVTQSATCTRTAAETGIQENASHSATLTTGWSFLFQQSPSLFSMHLQISAHELRILLTHTYLHLNLDVNMWESWQES